MDRLEPFFEKFSLTARMFYSGQLCGITGNHESKQAGHLHVLIGTMKVIRHNGREMVIDRPSILFFPRPRRHQLYALEEEGTELVCAKIEFGARMLNPLVASLPEPLVVQLIAFPLLRRLCSFCSRGAFLELPRRQASNDRLFEFVFVLLMRSVMDALWSTAGLSDSPLGAAIEAMHKHPETLWTLEEMAQAAGCRARGSRFLSVRRVGMTPFDCLTNWRLEIAQTMLRKGNSLKLIASAVGYANATALSRVFAQRLGLAPSELLGRSQGGALWGYVIQRTAFE